MRKHRKTCIEICAAAGLTVKGWERRSKHLMIVCAEGIVTCSCTPSKRQWRHHVANSARKVLRAAQAA